MGETAVAVFAKAPIAGYAKTRLIAALGAAGAAALQAALTEATLRTALAAGLGPVSLWCAPDREHANFERLARDYGVATRSQTGLDLGERMLAAFEALSGARPLLLVGTDCPMLTAAHLSQCAKELALGADAVFLPTEDGGYALVGARKPLPVLFEAMPWSTPRVMEETRARAAAAGLRIREPAIVWDVDDPPDYERALRAGLLDAKKMGGAARKPLT